MKHFDFLYRLIKPYWWAIPTSAGCFFIKDFLFLFYVFVMTLVSIILKHQLDRSRKYQTFELQQRKLEMDEKIIEKQRILGAEEITIEKEKISVRYSNNKTSNVKKVA